MDECLGATDWMQGRVGTARQVMDAVHAPHLAPDVAARVRSSRWGQWSAGRCWAASGAQAITASDGPPPGDVAGRVGVAGVAFEVLARALGVSVELDGAGLLGERAALAGRTFTPVPGRTLRGHGRMVRTGTGWLAINLPRPEDLGALPALTLGAVEEGDVEGFAAWARTVRGDEVVERGHLLGLALAEVPPRPGVLPEVLRVREPAPWKGSCLGPTRRRNDRAFRVVDFSGLWAGPLCTSLLAQLGADVVRVTGRARPQTPAPYDENFNALLSRGVRHLHGELQDPEAVRDLVADADLVVTSSRPAALERLGLTPEPGRSWIRITAHGADPVSRERVGFGDDAAASVGAVIDTPSGPCFAADALGDPITGLLAAVAGASLMLSGASALVDLSLAGSTAWAMGPQRVIDASRWPSSPPQARLGESA